MAAGDRTGPDDGYGPDGELRYQATPWAPSHTARGFTGRDKGIQFEGCYRGHADCLLVKTGSSALTLGQPNSRGAGSFMKRTDLPPCNDLARSRCVRTVSARILPASSIRSRWY